MRKNQSVRLKDTTAEYQDAESNHDYDSKQISSMIRRYQELRGVVEITSSRYERVGGSGAGNGKEEILCTIIDIDQAMKHLSPRQRLVITMLEKGYLYEEIRDVLGISINTVKFHTRQGIFHLTAYLNSR
jgi:DNA-directed RNA polymerase specialized sigma24 family protein